MSKSPTGIISSDDNLLSQIMHQARKFDEQIANEYAGREDEIDTLEDEIIKNCTNSPDLKLQSVGNPINCQEIFAASTAMLGRVTEIYVASLRYLGKLRASRQTILDGLLPLMQGGSADSREAKARGCMETINRLIALEESLVQICELTQKNIRTAQEMASRTLKAVEMDCVYFSGADALKGIVDSARQKGVIGKYSNVKALFGDKHDE